MKPSELDVAGYRDGLKGVDPQFVKRWSPRSMSGEGLSENQIMSLVEAARCLLYTSDAADE